LCECSGVFLTPSSKIVTSYNKFYAHDEKSEAKIGIASGSLRPVPLSKTKRWRLVEVVERGEDAVVK